LCKLRAAVLLNGLLYFLANSSAVYDASLGSGLSGAYQAGIGYQILITIESVARLLMDCCPGPKCPNVTHLLRRGLQHSRPFDALSSCLPAWSHFAIGAPRADSRTRAIEIPDRSSVSLLSRPSCFIYAPTLRCSSIHSALLASAAQRTGGPRKQTCRMRPTLSFCSCPCVYLLKVHSRSLALSACRPCKTRPSRYWCRDSPAQHYISPGALQKQSVDLFARTCRQTDSHGVLSPRSDRSQSCRNACSCRC
jgi:hypothetical protein